MKTNVGAFARFNVGGRSASNVQMFTSSSVGRVLFVVLLVLVPSCVPTPSEPDGGVITTVPGGVYTLCEGLWQQNNASLSYRDPNGTTHRDVFRGVNKGETVGDTPTDVVVLGDTMIVSVSTSRELMMIDRRTARVIRRTTIGATEQPYRLALAGDRLYASCLNADVVIEFNARTLERTTQNVSVGPAPEGVAATATKLYVAVSGLGDLRRNEPLSSTLQILRRSDMSVAGQIEGLWNVADVIADPSRNVVWATYRHFASEPDSLGGVVAIDTRADTVVRTFRLASPTRLTLDEVTGEVFVLHRDGIEMLAVGAAPRRVIGHTSGNGADVWYALWRHPISGHLYVGNARTFVTDGEVLVYSVQGALQERYAVGLNPTAFAY